MSVGITRRNLRTYLKVVGTELIILIYGLAKNYQGIPDKQVR